MELGKDEKRDRSMGNRVKVRVYELVCKYLRIRHAIFFQKVSSNPGRHRTKSGESGTYQAQPTSIKHCKKTVGLYLFIASDGLGALT